MRYGIQNSVMGWTDPWHVESSRTKFRTGEGKLFPSQDPMPTKEEYIRALQGLGADFCLQMCMPDQAEIETFIDDMRAHSFPFMLGNEFGTINGPYTGHTNRYDYSYDLVVKAAETGLLIGLEYDESEHLQLHPTQYQKDPTRRQWADVDTADPAGEIARAVGAVVNGYPENAPCYAEFVFPALMHVFARGGMNICPKILKEEYTCVQLAIAMGAAKQYGRKLGICVDLWGFDVGEWFTRLWGFPGHSPEEFRSALYASYYLAPEIAYVENCDVLLHNTANGFEFTEFGKIFRKFREDTRGRSLPYTYRDVTCKIAVICADNGIFSERGTFGGGGLFGGKHKITSAHTELFRVMHVLSHGTVSPQGSTYWNTDFNGFATGAYPRNEETICALPLAKGVGKENETRNHPFFYPMNSVLVFDHTANLRSFGCADVAIVCGEEVSERTAADLRKFAESGKTVFCSHRMEKKIGGFSQIVEDFMSPAFRRAISPYIGSEKEWVVSFGKYRMVATDPGGDGINVSYRIEES